MSTGQKSVHVRVGLWQKEFFLLATDTHRRTQTKRNFPADDAVGRKPVGPAGGQSRKAGDSVSLGRSPGKMRMSVYVGVGLWQKDFFLLATDTHRRTQTKRNFPADDAVGRKPVGPSGGQACGTGDSVSPGNSPCEMSIVCVCLCVSVAERFFFISHGHTQTRTDKYTFFAFCGQSQRQTSRPFGRAIPKSG